MIAEAPRRSVRRNLDGAPGQNFWDFSAIPLTPTSTAAQVPNVDVPFHEQFPTANRCIRYDDPSNGVYYNLFQVDNDSHEFIGFARSNGYDSYLSDPLVIQQFPYVYNSVINDTFTSNALGQGVNYTRTYDAYGTVLTPFGQFDNVIRQKVETESTTRYIWFTSNPYVIILTGNFDFGTVSFYEELSLSNPQYSKTLFSIYPNPTVGEFTIHNSNVHTGEAFVTVYDVLGKALITNEKFNGDNKNISLQDFSAGLYIVKIIDNENQVLYTQKIIKN